jgi:hypothetical protein
MSSSHLFSSLDLGFGSGWMPTLVLLGAALVISGSLLSHPLPVTLENSYSVLQSLRIGGRRTYATSRTATGYHLALVGGLLGMVAFVLSAY